MWFSENKRKVRMRFFLASFRAGSFYDIPRNDERIHITHDLFVTQWSCYANPAYVFSSCFCSRRDSAIKQKYFLSALLMELVMQKIDFVWQSASFATWIHARALFFIWKMPSTCCMHCMNELDISLRVDADLWMSHRKCFVTVYPNQKHNKINSREQNNG